MGHQRVRLCHDTPGVDAGQGASYCIAVCGQPLRIGFGLKTPNPVSERGPVFGLS